MIKDINQDEFKTEVFDFSTEQEWKFLGDKPTIIDFHAEWCGPCKMVGPILEEIAKEDESINILKVDVDANPELAGAFGIQSIPSMLFIPMDGQPQMSQGALPKEALLGAIENVLKATPATETSKEEDVKTEE